MDTNQLQPNNIYDQYRQTLDMPRLTNEEIDKMRPHVQLLARTICEHVWGEDFY